MAHIGIIDLSSKSTIEMLQQQLDSASFSNIILTSTLPPYNLSQYGQEIVDAFARTSPSKTALKRTLIENGPQLQHDNILHADRAFVEVTARHLLVYLAFFILR